MQRLALINGKNINYDHDYSTPLLTILNAGVVEGLQLQEQIISKGKALIKVQRTNGEEILTVFELTENLQIDTTGTKKIFIEVNQENIDNGLLNQETGENIAEIKTGDSYPTKNFLKLASIVNGVITDERVFVQIPGEKIDKIKLSKLVDEGGQPVEIVTKDFVKTKLADSGSISYLSTKRELGEDIEKGKPYIVGGGRETQELRVFSSYVTETNRGSINSTGMNMNTDPNKYIKSIEVSDVNGDGDYLTVVGLLNNENVFSKTFRAGETGNKYITIHKKCSLVGAYKQVDGYGRVGRINTIRVTYESNQGEIGKSNKEVSFNTNNQYPLLKVVVEKVGTPHPLRIEGLGEQEQLTEGDNIFFVPENIRSVKLKTEASSNTNYYNISLFILDYGLGKKYKANLKHTLNKMITGIEYDGGIKGQITNGYEIGSLPYIGENSKLYLSEDGELTTEATEVYVGEVHDNYLILQNPGFRGGLSNRATTGDVYIGNAIGYMRILGPNGKPCKIAIFGE